MTVSKQLQAAASAITKPLVAARDRGCPPFNPRKETTMSPQAGLVLVQEIAPRLRSAIPGVRKVGAEDDEELLQDGLTMAAEMLHNLEARGKSVTPGNVAYYCLLHLKSGRRSYSGGRTDVMGSGTQLDHSSMVLSFEEEVGFDPELGEPITLGELLTTENDDPAMTAGRNLDWHEFMDTHDHRFEAILDATACGQTMEPVARRYGCSLSTISSLKRRLSAELQESFGEDILTEVARRPEWQSSIQVEREKVACRADRRCFL